MSGTVSRAQMVFTLNRKEASRLIRDIAGSLATEDAIEMEVWVADDWKGEQPELRVGVRNSFGYARGPLLYSDAAVAEE